MTPQALTAVRRALLAWYDRARRDLPWRRHPDNAYYQWLAEIMLQQTQVATVIPYFERFIERYPTVADLAAADLDDVLQLWAGLGYYSRARNLHAAARAVCTEHGAQFPSTVAGLQSLPGVGRYTAGAIASIAFGVRAPILDGNVKRVLARWFAIDADMDDRATLARLWTLAEEVLPRKRCGDFNQALMELGATVCTPRSAACLTCPVARHCAALAVNRVDALPRPRVRRAPTRLTMVVAALEHDGALLLRRRPEEGLWGGLWELPATPLERGVKSGSALSSLLETLGLRASDLTIAAQPMADVAHQLTHRSVHFQIYACRSRNGRRPVRGSTTRKWCAPDQLDGLGLGTAQSKVIAAVRADRDA